MSSLITHSPPDSCLSEDQIAILFDHERDFLTPPEYFLLLSNAPNHATSRNQSVNWIVRVAVHHGFGPLTAILAVNYLDRFLAARGFPGRGWAFHLLSVACLSLAAKMEELYVPLLEDLQVLYPERVFHPKTVQRMELCVLGALKWRMRAISALDFLPYIFELNRRLFEAASSVVLRSLDVIELLAFSPSVVAAGAILHALDGDENAGTFLHKRVDLDAVRYCKQILEMCVSGSKTSDAGARPNIFEIDEPLPKRRRSL